MVRAIARAALHEAARLGSYRASFRGFQIYARRQRLPSGVCVSIGVAFGVTWCMQDMTLSLVSQNDCYVLPASMRDEFILAQDQEPIAYAQVR